MPCIPIRHMELNLGRLAGQLRLELPVPTEPYPTSLSLSSWKCLPLTSWQFAEQQGTVEGRRAKRTTKKMRDEPGHSHGRDKQEKSGRRDGIQPQRVAIHIASSRTWLSGSVGSTATSPYTRPYWTRLLLQLCTSVPRVPKRRVFGMPWS